MYSGQDFFFLDPQWTNPKRLAREREKSRALRKTHWWHTKTQPGICHYCQTVVGASSLTMDHIVPLARGGESSKNNIVAACRPCNQKKGLGTPVEELLRKSDL